LKFCPMDSLFCCNRRTSSVNSISVIDLDII
jgi:hypothetical protein